MKRNIKRFISCFLALLMLIASLPLSVSAKNGALEGEGTETRPYRIYDAEDLKAFRDLVNSGSTSICAELKADINLNPDMDSSRFEITYDTGYNVTAVKYDGQDAVPDEFEQWKPIGNTNNRYRGTFKGNGYAIAGIYINSPNSNAAGLFGYVQSGTIENLGVVNSVIRGRSAVGGILSSGSGVRFSGCYSMATVAGSDNVGGLVGYASSFTMNSCYNAGKVFGSSYVGGIIGRDDGSFIEECYNTGDIKGSRQVGGLLGFSNHWVADCYNTGSVKGANNVGSVIGQNELDGSIINCYYFEGTSDLPIGDDKNNQGDKVKVIRLGQLSKENALEFMALNDTYWEVSSILDGRPVLSSNPEPDGSADRPYLICTKVQLKEFRDRVNAGNNGACGKLMANICLNPTLDQSKFEIELNDDNTVKSIKYDGSETIPAEFEQWTPIAGNYKNYYKGTFNGNGYTISGIYMNINTSVAHGLFGGAVEANIKNLGIVNSFIKGHGEVGSILGYDDGLTVIENCYNSSIVVGDSSVGGIVGQTNELTYASRKRTLITQSYNAGKIIGKENVGGISGHLYCSDVVECYNVGEIIGASNVGGLTGYMWCSESSDCEVSDSYNAGLVRGGENCGAIIGGYYYGYVLEMFTIENIFYLEGSSSNGIGQSGGEQSENIIALTANQFTKADSFSNWNFNYVWTMGEDNGIPVRPILRAIPEAVSMDFGDGSAENPYLIYTKEQLKDFRDKVNAGQTDICGKLMADINLNPTLDQSKFEIELNDDYTFKSIKYDGSETIPAEFEEWNPIGVNIENSYTGTFNGNGHTVSGVYINNEIMHQGLFGNTLNSEIKNLSVVNSFIKGDMYVGGIAGDCRSTAVENCYNSGIVLGAGNVGGVMGNGSGATLANSYNSGKVVGKSIAGGVVGNWYNQSIKNCYNAGEVSGNWDVGGVAGHIERGDASNCYNAGLVEGNTYLGAVVGSETQGIIEDCYYLESGSINGIGKIESDQAEKFKALTKEQLANADNFNNWDFESVWIMGEYEGTPVRPILRAIPEEIVIDLGDGSAENPYLIYTKEQLEDFRDKVNAGDKSAQGKLMRDIVINPTLDQSKFEVEYNSENKITSIRYNGGDIPAEFEQWEPIGNDYYDDLNTYYGKFYGNGHTISGLYINTNDFYKGLFGYIENAEVSDVTVTNSFIKGGDYVGGIIGKNSGYIKNCRNSGIIVGGNYVGGIAGDADSVNSCYNTGKVIGIDFVGGVIGNVGAWISVNNCYNVGEINGYRYVGGVIGNLGFGATSNCYNIGAVNGSVYVGSAVGYIYAAIIDNCYYLDNGALGGIGRDKNNQDGKVKPLTEAQLANAENFNNWDFESVWIMGEYDGIPVRPILRAIPEEIVVDLGDGSPAKPYLIYTKEQLEAFRDKVNSGQTDICGRLMADINLNPTLDQSKFEVELNDDYTVKSIKYDGSETIPDFEQWTPIGIAGRSYDGIFDGNGHTVSGVYINNETMDQGLFGGTYTDSEIKNLGVVNSFIKGDNYTGGIVGENIGSVDNCYNTGIVVGNWGVGGVAGISYESTRNCYNSGAVFGVWYVGGIVGDNSDIFGSEHIVIDCYNTGTVCGSELVGGIVGDNFKDVKKCYNTGQVKGNRVVGGVVGYSRDSVTDCYNIGDVIGTEEIGGVVGSNLRYDITNCYNTGKITGDDKVGGILGYNTIRGNIVNCYYLESTSTDNGYGKALSIDEIEQKLLGYLVEGSGEGVWNEQCGAVGQWEYGAPAVQPIFVWQTPFENVPAYTVTIPETAEVNVTSQISVQAGGLRANQHITVTLRDNIVVDNGKTYNIPCKLFMIDEEEVLAGAPILKCKNTETIAVTPFVIKPAEKPKFSGSYHGIAMFDIKLVSEG